MDSRGCLHLVTATVITQLTSTTFLRDTGISEFRRPNTKTISVSNPVPRRRHRFLLDARRGNQSRHHSIPSPSGTMTGRRRRRRGRQSFPHDITHRPHFREHHHDFLFSRRRWPAQGPSHRVASRSVFIVSPFSSSSLALSPSAPRLPLRAPCTHRFPLTERRSPSSLEYETRPATTRVYTPVPLKRAQVGRSDLARLSPTGSRPPNREIIVRICCGTARSGRRGTRSPVAASSRSPAVTS